MFTFLLLACLQGMNRAQPAAVFLSPQKPKVQIGWMNKMLWWNRSDEVSSVLRNRMGSISLCSMSVDLCCHHSGTWSLWQVHSACSVSLCFLPTKKKKKKKKKHYVCQAQTLMPSYLHKQSLFFYFSTACHTSGLAFSVRGATWREELPVVAQFPIGGWDSKGSGWEKWAQSKAIVCVQGDDWQPWFVYLSLWNINEHRGVFCVVFVAYKGKCCCCSILMNDSPLWD